MWFWIRRDLNSRKWQNRHAGIHRLGMRADPRGIDLALGLIEDPQPEVRAAVAKTLGELGGRRAVDALGSMFRDPSPLVRDAAALALKWIGAGGDDSALQRLVDAMVQGEYPEAQRHLQWFGGRPVPYLIDVLAQWSPHMPTTRSIDGVLALLAQAGIGDRRAVPSLIRVVCSLDSVYSRRAEATLSKLEPTWNGSGDARAFVPQLLEALHREESRLRAAELLGRIGDARAWQPLLERLDTDSPDEIAVALARLGCPAAVGKLVKWISIRRCRLPDDTTPAAVHTPLDEVIQGLSRTVDASSAEVQEADLIAVMEMKAPIKYARWYPRIYGEEVDTPELIEVAIDCSRLKELAEREIKRRRGTNA